MGFWSWLGLSFPWLLGDVVRERPRTARRSVRRVLCDLGIPCLSILRLLGNLCIPCFLFFFRLLYLQFSPREVPLYVICRVEHPRWKKGNLRACSAPTGRLLPRCDAHATRCLHHVVRFACERNGVGPTQESVVAFACRLHCGGCVGGARCGQEVRVHVKIDVERRTVGVQRMGVCRRAGNTGVSKH
jgi:hypothetical protein